MNMENQTFAPTGEAQRLSTLLGSVATVAYITSTSVGMQRVDKQASKQADQQHNAKQGVGRVLAHRLAGSEADIATLTSYVAAARKALTDNTTAWGDRRLLPNDRIPHFLQAYAPAKKAFDDLAKSIAETAAQRIEAANLNKGTYDVEPPTLEELREGFTLDFKMEPVPDPDKFHASNLDVAMEAALKRRFEADIEAAYQQAQQDAIQRLHKPLVNLVERMTSYNEREELKAKGVDVGKTGTFNNTIIGNIEAMAEVFESFNLTGDPHIAKISEALDAFRGIEAKDLRNSKSLRDDTASKAKAILEQLGDWIS